MKLARIKLKRLRQMVIGVAFVALGNISIAQTPDLPVYSTNDAESENVANSKDMADIEDVPQPLKFESDPLGEPATSDQVDEPARLPLEEPATSDSVDKPARLPLEELATPQSIQTGMRSPVTNYNQRPVRLLRVSDQSYSGGPPLGSRVNCDSNSTVCDGNDLECSRCLDKLASKLKNFVGLGKSKSRCKSCGRDCNCGAWGGGDYGAQVSSYSVTSPVMKNTPAFGLISVSGRNSVVKPSQLVSNTPASGLTTEHWHHPGGVTNQPERSASLLDRVQSARTVRTSWQR